MSNNDPSIVPLSYHSIVVRENRFAQWLSRVPLWAIALTLIVPLCIVYEFGLYDRMPSFPWDNEINTHALFCWIAFFLPASVRRLNWRQISLMFCIACAWYAAQSHVPFPSWVRFHYDLALSSACAVFAAGIVEWWGLHLRSKASLGWLAIYSLTAAIIGRLIVTGFYFIQTPVTIHLSGSSTMFTSWGSILWWPLFAVLAWIAIPISLRLGQGASVKSRVFALIFSAMAALIFVLYFDVVRYRIALRSLEGNGPLGLDQSLWILRERGSGSDLETIWAVLNRAYWSKPDFDETTQYRRNCVNALLNIDEPASIRRLCRILQERPSEALAEYCADALARNRCYESVPVLMRYALQQNSECTAALESLRVPQAALAILVNLEVSHAAVAYGRYLQPSSDFSLNPDQQQRLTKLLGSNADPKANAWLKFYDTRIDTLPTPLSPSQKLEADAVVHAMAVYGKASGRLYKAKCRLFVRRVNRDGKAADLQDPGKAMEMDGYRQVAFDDMGIPPPDWNVPGTDGLEREVEGYRQRVDAVITRMGLSPATAPDVHPIVSTQVLTAVHGSTFSD